MHLHLDGHHFKRVQSKDITENQPIDTLSFLLLFLFNTTNKV